MRLTSSFVLATLSAVCCTLVACGSLVATGPQTAGILQAEASSLRTFLQHYAKDSPPREGDKGRYAYAFVDLDGDRTPEVIVYLSGAGWCGSGGCTMLVLSHTNSSFELVTKTTLVRLPIRVLASTSHGWRDIVVWVGGGGILNGHEVGLCFDGETYPSNPSIPPAAPLGANAHGKVVIPASSVGSLLYPQPNR